MITKIILKNVASYKFKGTILETNKKINLIYGLNGTGKSIFSKYFQELENEDYSNCSIEPKDNIENIEYLVYNHNIESDKTGSVSMQMVIRTMI